LLIVVCHRHRRTAAVAFAATFSLFC
jgi:hypothetical protein